MGARATIDTPWRGGTSGSISPCVASAGGVGPRLERSMFLLTGDENGFVPAVEGRDALGDARDCWRWSPRRSDRRSSPMKNGDSAGDLALLALSGRLEEVGMARKKCSIGRWGYPNYSKRVIGFQAWPVGHII